MGGVWERQIYSPRAILGSLLKTHGECLDDESLLTVMTEVEHILNSRPLIVEVLNDPASLQPLSPVNILTMKWKVVSPPLGEFSKPDIYSRKYWRRIQHIANEFWSRWKKEYLQSLQERQKWQGKRRNFKIGDIVVVHQNNVSRNHWPMARIINVNSDKKGLVRSVILRMGERLGNENSKRELERPVDKIVLIMGSDEVWFPTEKATCWDKRVISRGAMWSCTTRECNLNFACEGELVCHIGKYFVIPVFKDLLSNLIDLFLKHVLFW